ncbi:membrane protein [Steroidobacter agaridevorans]|uniref:Membrane protein n=1 Tax=Steroidobacter agaridevorans TaxID=2695856 RepID=A0A829YMX2_9GAMM|nr:cbb3-type cytochrome c oxidase subunit I [Steroidobacter agaridevorans]GFE84163.1 membrane protein [Steroidobacter agaridevorans]GFE86985.1 membrane protein [Steroidobacter agaridevorans]
MSTSVILASAFVLSFVALLVFIWSQRHGLFSRDSTGANVIFGAEEIGRAEEPAVTSTAAHALQQQVNRASGKIAAPASASDLRTRAAADESSTPVVFFMFCAAFAWLLVATAAGLLASYKLHEPDFLTQHAWLTFGRVRTLHLNAVAYGWAPMAGLGIAMFVLPRLLGRPLLGGGFAMLGAALWNAALISGLASIAVGINDGLEWLEIPWQIDVLFVAGGLLVAVPLVLTLAKRKVEHLYVSVWYMACALFWFPVMFVVANIPGLHRGVEQATMNWWFGHNVLGLFYTPLALAAVYYFLPKVIGRPVQSYNLSLLGFWGLAFFYGQVGGHHLIGGPVPAWLITLSIVQSMMMVLPVIAFTVNQYQTLEGYLSALRYSPTLRFIGLGGLMYTASSLQGSFEALRSVNAVTHFTHYTVGHSHLGLYAFVTLVFFGAMYFIVPRVTRREWPYPRLIAAHFWLSSIGVAIYVIALCVGGWLQGEAMLDAGKPFMDSVSVTLPYLKARTVGGALMGLGHLVFATHFACMIFNLGPRRIGATLLGEAPAGAP